MLIITTLFILSLFITLNHALPVTFTSNRPDSHLQTIFYTQNTRLYEMNQEENWFMSQEYDVFSSITDYYENMIDSTLNSASEDLLISLVHLSQEIKTWVLIKQAQLIGIHSLSDKQLIKMPSIIGKHVQKLNQKVYESIENIITLYWHTIWDPKLLAQKDQQEEHILSFLSSFNGIVAKELMEKMDEYDLIQEIKADILELGESSSIELNQWQVEEVENEQELTIFDWVKIYLNQFLNTRTINKKTTKTIPSKHFDLETDFLREYLSDMRTSLLMELHIQFMDFFTRIQIDIVDQLSIYYDDEEF